MNLAGLMKTLSLFIAGSLLSSWPNMGAHAGLMSNDPCAKTHRADYARVRNKLRLRTRGQSKRQKTTTSTSTLAQFSVLTTVNCLKCCAHSFGCWYKQQSKAELTNSDPNVHRNTEINPLTSIKINGNR